VSNVLRRLPSDAWDYVRDAPGTYLWLAALLVTTVAVRRLPADRRRALLSRNSTNLARLRAAPVRVLITSGLFVGDSGWWFYAAAYSLFHAPVEHWVGTWRWLIAVLITHVGATLVSQGWVAVQIRRGRLPVEMRDVDDYGVSYALAGSAALLSFAVGSPWRYLYLAAVVLFYVVGYARRRDFTGIGHVVAVLLGLSCFWLR
jgi:hypothetical protein